MCEKCSKSAVGSTELEEVVGQHQQVPVLSRAGTASGEWQRSRLSAVSEAFHRIFRENQRDFADLAPLRGASRSSAVALAVQLLN